MFAVPRQPEHRALDTASVHRPASVAMINDNDSGRPDLTHLHDMRVIFIMILAADRPVLMEMEGSACLLSA